jgi:hypothetical protein
LGPVIEYLADGFWFLILSNVFGLANYFTGDEKVQVSILRLKGDLWKWYEKRSKDFPLEDVHRLQELTVEMIGKPIKPKFRGKAAESKTLLSFMVDQVSLHQPALPQPRGGAFLVCGQSLVRFFELMENSDRNVPLHLAQEPHQ